MQHLFDLTYKNYPRPQCSIETERRKETEQRLNKFISVNQDRKTHELKMCSVKRLLLGKVQRIG